MSIRSKYLFSFRYVKFKQMFRVVLLLVVVMAAEVKLRTVIAFKPRMRRRWTTLPPIIALNMEYQYGGQVTSNVV